MMHEHVTHGPQAPYSLTSGIYLIWLAVFGFSSQIEDIVEIAIIRMECFLHTCSVGQVCLFKLNPLKYALQQTFTTYITEYVRVCMHVCRVAFGGCFPCLNLAPLTLYEGFQWNTYDVPPSTRLHVVTQEYNFIVLQTWHMVHKYHHCMHIVNVN